jgi:hypothetical protein
MNKAEMARQFARQTVEQEQNSDRKMETDLSEIINGIKAEMEALTIIMENQQKAGKYLATMLPSLEVRIAQITKLQKIMAMMYKEQKMLQKIWIAIFLVFAIPGAAAATTLILLHLFLR